MLKINSRKMVALMVINALLAVVFLSFSNCSSKPAAKGSASKSSNGTPTTPPSSLPGNCSLTGRDQLFALTYYPILRNQCAGCHVQDPIIQQGKGIFASPQLPIAYEAFSLAGQANIARYAVDGNHKPPFTGAINAAAINQATATWNLGVKEIANCQNNTVEEFVEDTWKAVRVHTKSKPINPITSGDSVITWDLNTDILRIPSGVTWPTLPGAKFQITVKPTYNGSRPSYSIYQPRIVYPQANAAAVDIHLQSIRVKINGTEVINETTFHYVNANIYKNKDTVLSAGAMVALGDLRKSDMISVSFGKAEIVVLPPPPPAPSVRFVTASTSAAEASLGTVRVNLQLSEAIDDFVTVSYSISTPPVEGSSATPDCCLSILNDGGQAVNVKNFDRDFIKPSADGGTIIFEPSVTTTGVDIVIPDDDRFEKNETVILKIDSITLGTAAGAIGAVNTHTITIMNDDAAPANGEITFSRLMARGGAFERYCIRCHHAPFGLTTPFREYDMTTHSDLISSNRVVPRQPDLSSMWWRIRGYDNQNNSVFPMPQGGLFDTDGIQAKDDIYEWIMSGAKNN
jgi:hypothetical protein